MSTRRSIAGRPEATTHAAIEEAAFALFAEHGFDGTTLDQIAAAVGVTRRTLFRYYASKNDIPWGRFDLTLSGFRGLLDAQPRHLPLHEAVGRGVAAFNIFPAHAVPHHATRMRLILETPTLRAHSALRYAEWRAVVTAFAAERRGEPVDALVPTLLGHLALGVALTAYERWLGGGRDDAASLLAALRETTAALGDLYTA